ncbi:MAG TPA: hypothetical protein QGG59_07825 [Planctomycetota bacterium]|jgi:hypothetical protein|nr:hypothetical protein [Planctomycetota bacterium]MDP7246627.1 hypothetical protein [Planctomycetota bacterium]HJM40007.1 hypothetical protein [Planctomycetota bacterium]|tara:strand:+ start:28231 stop:29271 length:1041 start_codon:yes stop_codon:yes gene_type:complete
MSQEEHDSGLNPTPFVVDAVEHNSQPPNALDSQTSSQPTPSMLPTHPRRGILGHFLAGLGLALARPRVLVCLVAFSILLALPTATTVYQSARSGLTNVAVPASEIPFNVAWSTPGWLLAEWKRETPNFSSAAQAALTPSILLSSLVGLLLAGGWMGIALSPRRRNGLLAFLRFGGEWFFPFFRTWLLGLPLFYGLTWIFWSSPFEWVLEQVVPEGKLDLAPSESLARWVEHGRETLYVLGLLVLELVLDLSRASMVANRGRSALLALFRGLGRFAYEPIRVLGFTGLGFVFELGWVVALSVLSARGLIPLWSLVFLLPFGRILCRAGRQAGLVMLVAEDRPLPEKA